MHYQEAIVFLCAIHGRWISRLWVPTSQSDPTDAEMPRDTLPPVNEQRDEMVTERNGPSQGLYFIFHALTLPFQYLCNSSRAILTSSQSGIVRTTSLTNFLTPVLVQLSVNDSLVPPGAIRFGRRIRMDSRLVTLCRRHLHRISGWPQSFFDRSRSETSALSASVLCHGASSCSISSNTSARSPKT